MSATAIRPLCAGRICRRRIVQISPRPSGGYLLLVLEGQPLRVTQQAELAERPRSKLELIALVDGAQ